VSPHEALSGALAHHLLDSRHDATPGIRGQYVISRAALDECHVRFRQRLVTKPLDEPARLSAT